MHKRIRPKNVRLERAHGLTKTHKDFIHLSKFWPIKDTTSPTHYPAGQYLSEISQPLTNNDYNIKDSFDAVN